MTTSHAISQEQGKAIKLLTDFGAAASEILRHDGFTEVPDGPDTPCFARPRRVSQRS